MFEKGKQILRYVNLFNFMVFNKGGPSSFDGCPSTFQPVKMAGFYATEFLEKDAESKRHYCIPGDESLECSLALTSLICCDDFSLSLSVMLFCGWLPLSAWKNLHLLP